MQRFRLAPSLLLTIVGLPLAAADIPWVLIRNVEAQRLVSRRFGPVRYQTWTPSAQDLRLLLDHLPEFYQRSSLQDRIAFQRFRFQLVPIILENQKLILVNAFTDLFADDWRQRAAIGFGGGPNLWMVEFLPHQRRFANLRVNGSSSLMAPSGPTDWDLGPKSQEETSEGDE